MARASLAHEGARCAHCGRGSLPYIPCLFPLHPLPGEMAQARGGGQLPSPETPDSVSTRTAMKRFSST